MLAALAAANASTRSPNTTTQSGRNLAKAAANPATTPPLPAPTSPGEAQVRRFALQLPVFMAALSAGWTIAMVYQTRRQRVPAQTEVTVPGLHFLPEDSAPQIAHALTTWPVLRAG